MLLTTVLTAALTLIASASPLFHPRSSSYCAPLLDEPKLTSPTWEVSTLRRWLPAVTLDEEGVVSSLESVSATTFDRFGGTPYWFLVERLPSSEHFLLRFAGSERNTSLCASGAGGSWAVVACEDRAAAEWSITCDTCRDAPTGTVTQGGNGCAFRPAAFAEGKGCVTNTDEQTPMVFSSCDRADDEQRWSL
ncbi:hypothetical protein JCM10450v2_008023 [Rhodotorula kratochvilovae]